MAQSAGYLQHYTRKEINTQLVRGCDISYLQYNANFVDFDKIYAAGGRFVIMKVSGGTAGNTRDTQFTAAHVAAARAAGLKVGTYHFAKPSVYGFNTAGAQLEADFYTAQCLAVFGDNSMGDLMPFMDWEDGGYTVTAGANDAIYQYCVDFANRVKANTGRVCGMYTAYYYVDAMSAAAYQEFVHSTLGGLALVMPLWHAANTINEYALGVAGGGNVAASPAYPNYNYTKYGGYNKWVCWQYCSDNPDFRQGKYWGAYNTPGDLCLDVAESLDDLMRPRQVLGVTAAGSNGVLTVTWNKNTDTDLVKYFVYLDGVKAGEVNQPTNYINLTVNNDQAYAVTVTAWDAWEESPVSATVNATVTTIERVGSAVTVQNTTQESFTPVYKPVNAVDSFYNPDGETNIAIKNDSGADITVTVAAQQRVVHRNNLDRVITVGAGKTRVIGGFDKGTFNTGKGTVLLSYSSTANVSSAAVKFI